MIFLNKINRQLPYLVFQQHVRFAVAFAVAIDLVHTVEYARSPVQQDKEGEDDFLKIR